MFIEGYERLQGSFGFYTTAAGGAPPDFTDCAAFMVKAPDAELAFLAPKSTVREEAGIIERVTGDDFTVFHVKTVFGPRSRGVLAAVAQALADGGLQVLCFCGGAGVYFAVPERKADEADKILASLGPPPLNWAD